MSRSCRKREYITHESRKTAPSRGRDVQRVDAHSLARLLRADSLQRTVTGQPEYPNSRPARTYPAELGNLAEVRRVGGGTAAAGTTYCKRPSLEHEKGTLKVRTRRLF